MSSDRPWAIDRLGKQRIVDSAYPWQKLYQSGAMIINGTDAPVEPINPLPSFYASVSRKTLNKTPTGGYEPGEKMSRELASNKVQITASLPCYLEGNVDKQRGKDGSQDGGSLFKRDVQKRT